VQLACVHFDVSLLVGYSVKVWVKPIHRMNSKQVTINVEQKQCLLKISLLQYVIVKFAIFTARPHLLAMQSAVLATAIPSVCLSVRVSHAGTLFRRMKIGSRGLHY